MHSNTLHFTAEMQKKCWCAEHCYSVR